MSMYGNDTKIYPDFNPSAPQDSQTCRLNKLSKIEAFFLNEFEKCEQKAKKLNNPLQY